MLLAPVGFTGTKEGLTAVQRGSLFRASRALTLSMVASTLDLHHGDCVGADAEMHDIARELSWHITLHPPKNSRFRAFCQDSDIVLPEDEYLVRNRHIVDASNIMFACPKATHEELRSGTWAAIRYSIKKHKRIYYFWPDGSVECKDH